MKPSSGKKPAVVTVGVGTEELLQDGEAVQLLAMIKYNNAVAGDIRWRKGQAFKLKEVEG